MTNTWTRPAESPFNERYFIWTHAYAWTNNTDTGYAEWFVELWFATPEADHWMLNHPVEHVRYLAERAALDSAGPDC